MCNHAPVRIALVEDDPSIAAAIVRMLRLAGIGADHFTSAEAFLSAGDVVVQCYVIDLHLPGMSGLELQRRLRSRFLSVPVVLISADDAELDREAAAGAAAVLAKPFTGRALADAVRSVTLAH